MGRTGIITSITQSGVSGGNGVAEKRVDFTYLANAQFDSIARYASADTSELVATSAFGYDAAGQTTSLTHTAADGTTTYADYAWTYNAAGEVASFTNSANIAGAGSYAAENIGSFTYDATGQLTAAAPPSGTAANAANSLSNSYDPNGNATTLNGASATPGAGNTLSTDGTYNYYYDADGNLTSKVGISGGAADGLETDYAYDNRNRLTTVIYKEDGDTTRVIAYIYDAFDRLVGLSDVRPGLTSSVVQQFIYDGSSMVLAFNGGVGHFESMDRYLWGPAVNQLLATEVNADAPYAGDTSWALGDNQNSVRDLVNDSGALTQHIAYSPFGQQLVLVSGVYTPSVASTFGYTGEFTDVITGDQLHGVRWYDPAMQRWLTQDPSGFAGGDANLYRYCGNGPTDYVDPSGMAPPPTNQSEHDSQNCLRVLQNEMLQDYPPPPPRPSPVPAKPGDEFSSPDAAAFAWGNSYNRQSIRSEREMASTIYMTSNGKYAFTEPNTGEHASAKPSKPANGQLLLGMIHSHGNYDVYYKGNVFSKQDKLYCDSKFENGYLTTPSGTLQLYDFQKKTITVISTRLASDENDPERRTILALDGVVL